MGEVLFQGDYFSLQTDATGNEYVASSGDEVLVVPLTGEDEVILTIEPSPAFGEPTLILPGGETKPDVANAEMANLELQEEIGCRAKQLDYLGELRPWSKYLAVRSFLYLARDLQTSWLPGDEPYEIGIEYVPLATFDDRIASGRLADARVIAALYMAKAFLQRELVRES